MKVTKETIGAVLIFFLIASTLAYKSCEKANKIQELERVIQMHKMYDTKDQLMRQYSKEYIRKIHQFRTINDSLQIVCTARNLTTQQYGTFITFDVTGINKLDKEIQYMSGTLTLSDSTGIIVALPVEVKPKSLPGKDTTYWQQSLNIDRYILPIKEALKKQDLRSLKTEWKPNVILFKDRSALVWKEISDQ